MQWPWQSHHKQPDATGESGASKGHGAEIIQQVTGEKSRGTVQRNVSTPLCQGKLTFTALKIISDAESSPRRALDLHSQAPKAFSMQISFTEVAACVPPGGTQGGSSHRLSSTGWKDPMVLGTSGKRWVLKDICMMKARHRSPETSQPVWVSDLNMRSRPRASQKVIKHQNQTKNLFRRQVNRGSASLQGALMCVHLGWGQSGSPTGTSLCSAGWG